MRALLFALCLSSLLASAATPDLNREKLASMDLARSPLLRAFSAAARGPAEPPLFEPDVTPAAAMSARYFAGPTELRYTVLLFPSEAAMREWDRRMSGNSAAWFSPFRRPVRHGIRECLLGGALRDDTPRGRAIVVNRILITLNVFQHDEIARRRPESARRRLPTGELCTRFAELRAELTQVPQFVS
jgi:hypothetical protein